MREKRNNSPTRRAARRGASAPLLATDEAAVPAPDDAPGARPDRRAASADRRETPPDRRSESLAGELRAVNRPTIGRLSRLVQADSGMSAADYLVLVKLTESGGRMRFTELVEWEKSRMSHQVGRMTKRGLVAKEDCPDDGRGAFIVATPAGHKAIEDAAPPHVAHVRRLFIDALTPEELTALAHISTKSSPTWKPTPPNPHPHMRAPQHKTQENPKRHAPPSPHPRHESPTTGEPGGIQRGAKPPFGGELVRGGAPHCPAGEANGARGEAP